MSKELILTKIRITLLETQIYDTAEKKEIYFGALERIAIEMKSFNTKEEAEMADCIGEFIKSQKEFFANVIEENKVKD